MTELVDAAAVAHAAAHTTPLDAELAAVAAWTEAATDAPQMISGVSEARLLQALIVAGGARSVLEIGTFTGFGALAMAAALPPGGRVTTIEADPQLTAAARAHLAAGPHADRIDLLEGDALELLTGLDGPFDLVYLDAWKSDYPAYWDLVAGKLSERGVLVADNLFRGGLAFAADAEDPSTVGIRAFAEQVQADPRFDNVLLTVGDGLMLAWRAPAA